MKFINNIKYIKVNGLYLRVDKNGSDIIQIISKVNDCVTLRKLDEPTVNKTNRICGFQADDIEFDNEIDYAFYEISKEENPEYFL